MARPLAPCGTYSAYLRHRKRDEPVDEACEQAHQDHLARQRESKAAQHAQVVPIHDRPEERIASVPNDLGLTVACPVCQEREPLEYPYDAVAIRMAAVRHMARRQDCAKVRLSQ